MRIQRRGPQAEAKGVGSDPAVPSPSPTPTTASQASNTTTKKNHGDGSDSLPSSSPSPDSISNLLSPLPLPQKARFDNSSDKAPRPRETTTFIVPLPPRPHAAAKTGSQLTGAFLGSLFILLLALSILYTWRLRTRRKRREVKDHKAWLKVQMRTPGSESGFKQPPSVMTSYSRSTCSKSLSAYSKSLHSCSDVSTNVGDDMAAKNGLSNLYTVAPASWSDLSARSRYEQRRTALNRVALETGSVTGQSGILVLPSPDGSGMELLHVDRSGGAREVGGSLSKAGFLPGHARRSSITSRATPHGASTAALPFDPSSSSISRPAACRPSTHSVKSRWSISESFDDIDEASMWLPAKVSHPPSDKEEDKEGSGSAKSSGTDQTAIDSNQDHSQGSSAATAVGDAEDEKGKEVDKSTLDEAERLTRELAELEASCGRISVEALNRSQREPPIRPPRIRRPPTALSIVSEGGETASIVGTPCRQSTRLSNASFQ